LTQRAQRNSSADDPGSDLPELGVGIVYSSALEPLLETHPEVVDVLEIEPQTTWLERPDRPGEVLVRSAVDEHLARLPYHKLVHSIGTPVGGSIPGSDEQFSMLRDTVRKLRAPWASEHLAFNLTPDFFTGFFLPPRQTAAGLDIYAGAVRQLNERIEVPIAIETGVNYLRPRADEIPDGEFVATLVNRSSCGILLDLHNNRGAMAYGIEAFEAGDPLAWPSFATEDDVAGLVPTVISVNECDPLRDEGIEFYRLLLRAGVPARCRQVMGTMHGVEVLTIACPDISRETAGSIAQFARTA